MTRSLLSAAILAALVSSAGAQSAPELLAPRPVQGPTHEYVFDYATKTLTKVGTADDREIGVHTTSTVAYDNSCTSGFFTSRPFGQEVFDWGTKAAGLTTIVDSFQFGYATAELDPMLGGTGANIDIAFFEGAGLGFGTIGTEVARFSFTGLPGATSVGGIGAYLITVTLTGGSEFCLADGEIGYSYCINDMAGTGPLIGDIAACPNGQDDAFDIYACGGDPASYSGTFFFGGTPTATFYMVINEDDGSQLASQNFEPGSGVNLNGLSASAAPALGTTWDPNYFDLAGLFAGSSGGGLSTALWYTGRLPNGSAITSFGEVLVDPSSVNLFTDAVAIINYQAEHFVPIPAKDLSLLDLGTFYVQAVRMGDGAPPRLSTLIEAVVGF